jgi:hypothetical protein
MKKPNARAKTPYLPMKAVTAQALEESALRAEARATLETLMTGRGAPDLQALVELLESRQSLAR